jgi:hypothetical protein
MVTEECLKVMNFKCILSFEVMLEFFNGCMEQPHALINVLVSENGIITAERFNQINKIGQKFRPQKSPIQRSY